MAEACATRVSCGWIRFTLMKKVESKSKRWVMSSLTSISSSSKTLYFYPQKLSCTDTRPLQVMCGLWVLCSWSACPSSSMLLLAVGLESRTCTRWSISPLYCSSSRCASRRSLAILLSFPLSKSFSMRRLDTILRSSSKEELTTPIWKKTQIMTLRPRLSSPMSISTMLLAEKMKEVKASSLSKTFWEANIHPTSGSIRLSSWIS